MRDRSLQFSWRLRLFDGLDLDLARVSGSNNLTTTIHVDAVFVDFHALNHRLGVCNLAGMHVHDDEIIVL